MKHRLSVKILLSIGLMLTAGQQLMGMVKEEKGEKFSDTSTDLKAALQLLNQQVDSKSDHAGYSLGFSEYQSDGCLDPSGRDLTGFEHVLDPNNNNSGSFEGTTSQAEDQESFFVEVREAISDMHIHYDDEGKPTIIWGEITGEALRWWNAEIKEQSFAERWLVENKQRSAWLKKRQNNKEEQATGSFKIAELLKEQKSKSENLAVEIVQNRELTVKDKVTAVYAVARHSQVKLNQHWTLEDWINANIGLVK